MQILCNTEVSKTKCKYETVNYD